MPQLIIMPVESYNVLIESCAESCPEYELLKNGFIMRNEAGEEEVYVPCDSAIARIIFDFATQCCPETVPHITTKEASLWPG